MCTCFLVKAKDNSVVVGRTMEFGIDPGSRITVFPRGYKFQAIGVDKHMGFAWTGQYGFVGMDMFGLPMVSDGLNEKGLYVGDLYLPGFAEYQEVPIGQEHKSMAPIDVAGYLLSMCSTVEEAKRAISEVFVWPYYAEQIKTIPPLHFAIHDATGASAVFEYVKGNLKIHDNPIGVLTNSPTFDWHMINIRNFVNLSATNVPELKLNGGVVSQLGQGTGMLGLPGDSTPPSRFIRAVAFTQSAVKPANGEEAINMALHIANNFDIPKGFSRDTSNGVTMYDFTFWTTLSDLTEKIYYYRGYQNVKIYRVSLMNLNFNGPDLARLDTSNSDWFQELS